MKLKDTVEMMLSEDYKERFKAEYYQTKERYERLKNFNNKIEAYELLDFDKKIFVKEPKHDCPSRILKEQQKRMSEYLHILEIRAVIEKIEL